MDEMSRSARPHPFHGHALLLLVACGVLQGACAAEPSPSASRREPAAGARRIVLVALDGADWMAIDPLVEAGKLPTFARLKGAGRTGLLVATPPLLSPIVWTTIATGRSPEDHGILDFMADVPSGGQAPIASTARRVPALWNLFSDAGREVAVVGWWATWPAERVRGTIVSDRVAPQLTRPGGALDPQAVFPPEAAARLSSALVRPDEVKYEDLKRYVPLTRAEFEAAMADARGSASRFFGNRLAHLAAVIAGTRTHAAMAEALLKAGPPDLLAVYLEGVDTVSHLFVKDPRRGPPAIEAAYRDADDLIARLSAASAPEALVIVCSDHGFHAPDAAAALKEDPALLTGPAAAWHRPYGIVAVAEARALAGRPQEPTGAVAVGTVTPLDIAPTVLHLAGLAVGAEMPGRVVPLMLPPDAAARPVQRRPTPRSAPRPEEPPAGSTDEAALARLRALGYVGAQPTSLARQNLGEILYREGKLAAAERQLRAVVAGQPSNLSAHLWLAKALRDQGRSREALRIYEEALRLPGGPAEALVESVELAVSAGLEEEAQTILTRLEASTAASADVQTARAVLAQAGGRTRLAEQELKSALAIDPMSFPALSRLLDLLLPARRAREALPFVRRAAERAPGSPRHAALFGEALLAAGESAAAERELRRALELAPDGAAVRIDLARAQIAQGRAAEAQATLASGPPSAERSILLGVASSAQGRWHEAAAHYQAALEGGSPTPELLNGLGWAEHKLGENHRAAEILRRSLALDANQPEIRRLLAEIESSGRPR